MPTRQSGAQLLTQHSGITSRHHNIEALFQLTPHIHLPTFHHLYLVKEKPLSLFLLYHLVQHAKILHLKIKQIRRIKVHIQ